MLYFGSYKVSNYKNIKSIPDIKSQCITKNKGVVFVVSDTLFTNNNSEITQDFIKSAKIFLDKLERQIRVFKNVEAIVLNGNIFRGMFSISNVSAFDSSKAFNRLSISSSFWMILRLFCVFALFLALSDKLFLIVSSILPCTHSVSIFLSISDNS